jgi:hypothetical protein
MDFDSRLAIDDADRAMLEVDSAVAARRSDSGFGDRSESPLPANYTARLA